MKVRREVYCLSNSREKDYQLTVLYQRKISLKIEEKIKTFSGEEKLRLCCQQIYPRRIDKGISPARKEMVLEGILEQEEEGSTIYAIQRAKLQVNKISYLHIYF